MKIIVLSVSQKNDINNWKNVRVPGGYLNLMYFIKNISKIKNYLIMINYQILMIKLLLY